MKHQAITRVLLAITILLTTSPMTSAAPAVQDYAQQTIDQGIAILKDASLSPSARRARLRDYLQSTLDIERIALFVLGNAASTATPSDLASYLQAFENFTLANYESQVGGYGGQLLKIRGTVERAPGDYILETAVIDPTAPSYNNSTTVYFRIVTEGDKFVVVDASVEGVWFEVAQRDGIQGFLTRNGGSIPKLVDHLKQMTAQLPDAQ